MSLKNPVTPPEIDPGTIQLVAHCLNHYATPGPKILNMSLCKYHDPSNVTSLLITQSAVNKELS
jgi:hypothetical protein